VTGREQEECMCERERAERGREEGRGLELGREESLGEEGIGRGQKEEGKGGEYTHTHTHTHTRRERERERESEREREREREREEVREGKRDDRERAARLPVAVPPPRHEPPHVRDAQRVVRPGPHRRQGRVRRAVQPAVEEHRLGEGEHPPARVAAAGRDEGVGDGVVAEVRGDEGRGAGDGVGEAGVAAVEAVAEAELASDVVAPGPEPAGAGVGDEGLDVEGAGGDGGAVAVALLDGDGADGDGGEGLALDDGVGDFQDGVEEEGPVVEAGGAGRGGPIDGVVDVDTLGAVGADAGAAGGGGQLEGRVGLVVGVGPGGGEVVDALADVRPGAEGADAAEGRVAARGGGVVVGGVPGACGALDVGALALVDGAEGVFRVAHQAVHITSARVVLAAQDVIGALARIGLQWGALDPSQVLGAVNTASRV
jgi:hypothetical protein